METITQRELEAKLRQLSKEECELLTVADENICNVEKRILETKSALSDLRSSFTSLCVKKKDLEQERKNIKLRYKCKRKDLLATYEVTPGVQTLIREPLTRQQLHVVRRLFQTALYESLVAAGHPTPDACAVNFTLNDDGVGLAFHVVLPQRKEGE